MMSMARLYATPMVTWRMTSRDPKGQGRDLENFKRQYLLYQYILPYQSDTRRHQTSAVSKLLGV